jgi:hypothetical protein
MLAEAATATSNRTDVLAALKQASAATGTDFNYLLDTATRESGLKSSAKVGASSASGLFQFVSRRGSAWSSSMARNKALARMPARFSKVRTAASMWTISPTTRQFLPCGTIRRLRR